MGAAFLRFYAELNDFLSADRRQTESIHFFEGRVSIKDMIESLGVPHTEVDLILVRSESVDFSYIVQDGDRITESCNVNGSVRAEYHAQLDP